jgi:hypothetical protein
VNRSPGDPEDPWQEARQDARRMIEEAARLIDLMGGLSQAHTGPECRICPVCRLLAGLREVRPEVVDHLAAAAEELLAAVREFVAPSPPATPSAGASASPSAAPEEFQDEEPDEAFAGEPDDALAGEADGALAGGRGGARSGAPAAAVQHIEITE